MAALTDVKKPSLHAAFGDKAQLFSIVLERYHAMVMAANQLMLQAEGPVREVIRQWLTAFLPFCTGSGGEKGCLSVNTSLEASELVPQVREAIDAYQAGVLALLKGCSSGAGCAASCLRGRTAGPSPAPCSRCNRASWCWPPPGLRPRTRWQQ